MPANVTWVVVADGARARFFVNEGAGTGLRQMPETVMEGDRGLPHEMYDQKPGRGFASRGGQRHGMEEPASRDPVERAFLKQVLDRLEEAQRDGAFDRLVIVAAPIALGEIRETIAAPLQGVLIETFDKDLTRAPLEDVARLVADTVRL